MIKPTPARSQPDQPENGDANAPTLDPGPLAPPAATLAPTETPAPAEPPAVPGYEILSELGRGGMGIVYQARQLALQRIVALKMILAGFHATADTLARFRTEAEAVARLQHANIVQIHEIGEQQGLPYFSMEYVAGGSLADKLAGTPVPPRDAAKLVEKLARTIHYAHQHGIVHRDLKPANILLDAALVPKITDFGLAKQLDSEKGQTRTGAILGTPSYMAPEQAGGSMNRDGSRAPAPVGPAADVYALGAILYEMLVGRPPFKASTPLDTVLQVVSEEPVPPCRLQPKLPGDLETTCLKCLEKDPRRRYASAEALAEDLRRFLADEPILARPASRWERTTKWTRRQPALAALLVLSIAAPLALAVISLAFQARLQHGNDNLRLALAEVETERDHATEAKKETEREHGRAQAHLEKALEAVNRMLTRVGDERLANVPQFAELRRQVLEEALDFYRGFLKQEGDEPALRRETARAYLRTAELYFMLSKSTEAENACKEAIALLEKLVAEDAGAADYRHDLSRTYSYLGHVYATTARFEQAGAAYGKALALSERIVEQHPENLEYIAWLVQTYSTQGYALAYTNPKQAEDYFRRAAAKAEKLLAARPESEDFQCKLAGVYMNLGRVLLAQQRVPEAGEMLQKSTRLLLPPEHAPPRTPPEYPATLAMTQIQQGLFLLRTGKPSEALAQLQAGVAGFEQLLRATPKMLPYRSQLATTYPTLADLYVQSKQPDRAVNALERAIELAEEMAGDYPTFAFLAPEAERLRVRCLLIQARQGEIEAVIAAAKALELKKGLAAENLYDLARVYALAAVSPRTEKSTVEELLGKALALLARLEGAGYFGTKARVERARKDDDLKALREREQFKRLLEKAEKQIRSAPPGAQP